MLRTDSQSEHETYKGNEIVSPLVSQISWTNNILVFQMMQF